jgi:hypothetical protein
LLPCGVPALKKMNVAADNIGPALPGGPFVPVDFVRLRP